MNKKPNKDPGNKKYIYSNLIHYYKVSRKLCNPDDERQEYI